MSKHWRPDENATPLRPDRARGDWAKTRACWREEIRSRPLPHGSRTALVLLALACLGAAALLYEIAGPRDVFERDSAVDWDSIDRPAGR